MKFIKAVIQFDFEILKISKKFLSKNQKYFCKYLYLVRHIEFKCLNSC